MKAIVQIRYGRPEDVLELRKSVPTAGYIGLLNLRGSTEVKPGYRVFVNSAGGGVDSIAVQVATARGATVTAVDNQAKLEMLRDLGTDKVIDYRIAPWSKSKAAR